MEAKLESSHNLPQDMKFLEFEGRVIFNAIDNTGKPTGELTFTLQLLRNYEIIDQVRVVFTPSQLKDYDFLHYFRELINEAVKQLRSRNK